MFTRLVFGVLINDWPADIVATEGGKKRTIEDFPWAIGCRPSASARVRDLLERLCPGAIQFLPYKVEMRHKPGSFEQLFILNFQVKSDCLSIERSYGPSPVSSVGYSSVSNGEILPAVISSDSVPDRPFFGRLSYSGLTCMSGHVLNAFVEHGITGYEVETLWHDTDQGAPEPNPEVVRWLKRGGKAELDDVAVRVRQEELMD